MYTFDGRIRYSEIDHNGRLKLPALINYFQDCGTFQSEDIGQGLEVLKERKRAWFLCYWQVEIRRYPKLAERITTGTFASGFDKFFGYRYYVMTDEQQDWAARAYSLWVNMNTETSSPERLEERDIEGYQMGEALDMKLERRKIKLPSAEDFVKKEPFPVLKCHIDTNEHTNNCQYVQMALELLPKDQQISRLRAEYKKAAKLGDVIYPQVADTEGRTTVLLCDAEENPYAVLEFT